MKELGLALLGSFSIFGFFNTVVYPDLEYTGYSSTHNCTGECYEEYVKVHGTVVEQLQRQQVAELQKTHLVQLEVFEAGCATVMETKVKVWECSLNLMVNLQII